MFSFWKEETQPSKSSEEPQDSGQPQAYDQPENPGYQPAYGQQPPPYGTVAPNAVHKGTRNKLLNVALAIGSFGLLLAVIGVSTCQWFVTNLGSMELFVYCNFECSPVCVGSCPEWIEGTRAMVVMGIILTGVGVILLVVNRIPIVAGLACLVGGICHLIGVIISGKNVSDLKIDSQDELVKELTVSLGWSFFLVIFAAILELVAGVLVVANALRSLLKKK